MRKVTQENINELATELINSVGTQDFKKGLIYYKEGKVKLSVKPLTAELYLDIAKTQDLYVMAEAAVLNRKRNSFRSYLLKLSTDLYNHEKYEVIEESKRVYQYFKENAKLFDELSEYVYGNAYSFFDVVEPVLPIHVSEFNKLKNQIESYGLNLYKGKRGARYFINIAKPKHSGEYTSLKATYTALKNNSGNFMSDIISSDEKLENFINQGDKLKNILSIYKEGPNNYDKIKEAIINYEQFVASSFDTNLIKIMESAGYLPLQIVIIDHKIKIFNVEANDNNSRSDKVDEVNGKPFAPRIDIESDDTSQDANNLKISINYLGSFKADDLQKYLARFQVAIDIVNEIKKVDNLYYKNKNYIGV